MKNLFLLLAFVCAGLLTAAQYSATQYYFAPAGPPAGEIGDQTLPVIGQKPLLTKELDWDSLNMQFTGNWPFGQPLCVHSSPGGDTVFFGSGAGMIIVDASDPYNPVQLSEVRARALVDHAYYDASSGLLFLAAYFSGVEIWDVSDMTNPYRISRIPLNSYPRGGIFARDGILYVVTVADGMEIYDISDPSQPVHIAHQAISGALVWSSSFDGDYAYLSQGSSGLKIVNISDPHNPFIEKVFSANVAGLQVVDQSGYILISGFGLRIYDFTDLNNITMTGELAITGNPVRLAKVGDYLYVTNSTTNPEGGICTIDISDPALPVLLNTLDPPETYISGGGNVIAASGNTSGLLLVDISDPALPQYASELDVSWMMMDIAAQGDYAYTGSNGFRVFDMSDPAYPVQVGYNETDGAIARISDTLAVYIPSSMGSGNKVNIMDVSDPADPQKLGHYSPPVMTNDLVLKDHYAYVACWWDGFRVVDFSDPNSPVLVSHDFGWVSGAVPGEEFCYAQALDIYGNYLYVLDYGPFETEDTKGIYIFDISTPDDPQLIKRYTGMLSRGHDLRAWGDYLYITDKDAGFEVINVADPANPFNVSYTGLTDAAWTMDISWPYAYVSQYILGGVHILNVMDPYDPFVAAYYQRSGCFTLGVTVWDNYALVADGIAGMGVYDNLLATGLPETDMNTTTDMELFPNPAGSSVTVRLSKENAAWIDLSIVDISGRKIKVFPKEYSATGTFTISLDTEGIPPGMYILQAVSDGVFQSSKLIIR